MPPESDRELLARIDERTKALDERMDDFVTKAEFAPVRAIVFGGVGVVLSTVLITLLYLARFKI